MYSVSDISGVPTAPRYQAQSPLIWGHQKTEWSRWMYSWCVSEQNHLLVDCQTPFSDVTMVCSMLASGWRAWNGLRKVAPSLEVQFLFCKVYYCVCACVYSVGWACTMYVFALVAKVVWPSLFWCNLCIDAQMSRSLQLSPLDSNTDRRLRVHAHLVDKQSEHHKGTIATILLPTQQTRPFKMSNEKAVARVQCSIDSKWAHHLTTMPNLWTPSILDTK